MSAVSDGLLGDTSGRDYSRKLPFFNVFAAQELREVMAQSAALSCSAANPPP